MINSPYDTTIGKAYNVNHLVSELTKVMASNLSYLYDHLIATNDSLPNIVCITEDWRTVPHFNQCISLDDARAVNSHNPTLFVDVRQLAKIDSNGRLKYRSSNEKLFTKIRSCLTASWMNNGIDAFHMASDAPLRIYAQWLSKALSRTYPFDHATNVRLTALAGLFFYSHLAKTTEMSEKEGMMVADKIASRLMVPKDIAESIVLDEVGAWISTIEDFCDSIKSYSENISLDNMNPVKLITALGGTWYGASAHEHVGVALEYMPTFYAMVIVAMQDNSYRKTMIGQIVKDNSRDRSMSTFTNALAPIII